MNMNLHIRPILTALFRNRTGAVLVALQIAIALAVLVNAVYIVKQRVVRIGRPSGVDVENIIAISSTGFTSNFDRAASVREDLAWLRGLDGVVAATLTSSIPMSGSGSATTVFRQPAPKNGLQVFYYHMDEHAIDALGLKLIAGRGFTAADVEPEADPRASEFVSQVLLTQSAADALFPGQNAVGKTVYAQLEKPATVIGVVERLHGSWMAVGDLDDFNVFIGPRIAAGPVSLYLVRTKPGQRDAILKLAEAHLSASNPGRVIDWVRTLELFKRNAYLNDRNMGIFLIGVTALLFAVTALGIFGLATFNVSTRTKQIGTRRAIGARRGDIVRYFLVENWLITSAGVVIGCALALGVGYWLSLQFQLPRLDLYYLLAGTLVVWAAGQLSAWQPARRASAVSPSVATRTV